MTIDNDYSGFFLNALRTVVVSAIISIVAMLWNVDRQVAVNSERISEVLARSDRQDNKIQHDISRIEKMLAELLQRRPEH